MKTKNSSPARNVVLAALFLALAFVLPMIAGMISGFYTSLCLSGPLWVTWQEYKAKKKASKTASAE